MIEITAIILLTGILINLLICIHRIIWFGVGFDKLVYFPYAVIMKRVHERIIQWNPPRNKF